MKVERKSRSFFMSTLYATHGISTRDYEVRQSRPSKIFDEQDEVF